MFFLFISSYSFGQISEEIDSYVDSIELKVQNGRKMILYELNDSNLVKVKQIYDYLNSIIQNKDLAAFYYLEDIYINLLTKDWQKIDELMLGFETYKNKTLYQNSTRLIPKLYELTSKNAEQIRTNCTNSSLNSQAKKLVGTFLQYIDENSSDEEYNKILTAYKKEFKESDYQDFEQGFLPPKKIKTSVAYAFGSGIIFTTNDLADHFPRNATFNMGIDFNIGRVFTSLYFQGSNLKLQKPFTAFSESQILNFTMNEKFSFIDAGLKAGYHLIRNDRFHLTPYASFSGTTLESKRFNSSDQNHPEYQFINSFAYGAGLHTEFKLYEFEKNNLYYAYDKAYISIKLEAGYNKINSFRDPYAKGDTPYLLCALVLGFGDF